MTESPLPPERADLLESLKRHRFFLRNTARNLTDEPAGRVGQCDPGRAVGQPGGA